MKKENEEKKKEKREEKRRKKKGRMKNRTNKEKKKRRVCKLFQNLWNMFPWFTTFYGKQFQKQRMVDQSG